MCVVVVVGLFLFCVIMNWKTLIVRQEQQCYQLNVLSPGHVLRYYHYYYCVLRTRIFVIARLFMVFEVMKRKPRVSDIG